MTKKRKSLGQKKRFEVFKRDSFTCQYCGNKAPDVILNVDHIEPVSKGGSDKMVNLITSCFDCNSGKSDRLLSDDSVVEKQRRQLEALQERRTQIEMMLEWQKSIDDTDIYLINEVSKFWSSKVDGFSLTDNGLNELANLLKKYGIEDVFNAIRESTSKYLKYINGNITPESVEISWKRVGGILATKDNPDLSRLYYIRGIARNTLNRCDDRVAIILLRRAYDSGADIDELELITKEHNNWYYWKETIETYINHLENA